MSQVMRPVPLRLPVVLTLAFLSLAAAACATGGGSESSGSGSGEGAPVPGRAEARVGDVVFSTADRTAIQEWYGRRGLPPGLAKKSELPPGLRRQLQRRGTLPPGLAKQALPGELESRLSPLPEGYGRYLVAGDVMLVETATGLILDLVQNVGRSRAP